jgi:hypothetical protein
VELLDIQFKDVTPFSTFFLYGEEYLKVSNTKCVWKAKNITAECDPENWVQVNPNRMIA